MVALREYILGGGAVVTGEWFMWSIFTRQVEEIVPVLPISDYCGYNKAASTTYKALLSDPTINNGLPPNLHFTISLSNFTGTESCFVQQAGAEVFYSSSNGGGRPGAPGLLGWNVGGGRIASFSTLLTAIALMNSEYRRLFVNTVEWAAEVRSDVLRITRVSPNSGGNTGKVTVIARGTGFQAGATVRLKEQNQIILNGQDTFVVSKTQIQTGFDLRGLMPRALTFEVINPDSTSTVAPDPFTITVGIGPRLQTRLVAPEAVRPRRQYVLWLEYANTGDNDMPAPLFVVSGPQSVSMRLSPDEPYTTGPIQVLGISFDQPAGTLRPGSQYRIPIYFQAAGTGRIQFNLEQMVADTTPIDWGAVEANYRWEEIDPGVWNPFWQAFITRVGEARVGYLATLGDAASALAENGLPVYDIPTLLSAVALEVAGATGNPLMMNGLSVVRQASADVASSSDLYHGVRLKTFDRSGNLVDITDFSSEQIREIAPRDWGGDTRLVVHGWNAQASQVSDWPIEMGSRMRGVTPNDLIVMVDIGGYRTGFNPYVAAGFVPEASDGIAQFWRNHGLSAASTHCIGHSLGAHTCTEVSVKLKEWQGKGFGRCSALDAAAIGSQRSLANCSDTCVDQYKSSVLGIRGNQGHVVWSVRGGSHNNARMFFADSIGNQECAGDFDVGCNVPGPYRWKGNLNLNCTGACTLPASQQTEIEPALRANGSCQDLAPNQQPPKWPGANLDETPVDVIRPVDPNEKAGPKGVGTDRVVGAGDELHYTVYFENVPKATAPAQEVFITDPLDPDLDWSTFQVTEIAFGDRVIAASEGTGGFYARALVPDYRPEADHNWWVDVTAEIDYQTGRTVWTFRTLDPVSGELPEDPLAGFLPPNDGTGRGEGHVTFSVQPKSGAPARTRVTNSASIVFDTNDPIKTNEVWNTVGYQVFLPLTLRSR
jgi:hypothetical protein